MLTTVGALTSKVLALPGAASSIVATRTLAAFSVVAA